ncbi:MAG: LPS assembly protein LptD [Methylococcales bacterium]|nr:LPS assembly protein LptD [Methylococcales bacterium]
MFFRLFFIFFLFLTIDLSFADDHDWSCEKGEENGWSCGGNDVHDKTRKQESSSPKSNDKPGVSADSIKKTIITDKPPKTSEKNSGWNCYTGDADEKWNCSLKGVDPKGRTRIIKDDEDSFSLFSDAFDFNKEQNFKTLQSQLAYDPWKNCGASSRGKYTYIQEKDIRNTVPMDVTADYSEVFDKEITSFFGNVEITRADQKVLSDRASFDIVSETMDAQGQVSYTENEVSLFSDTALLNLNTNEARLRNAIFISPSGPIRGSADVVYRDSNVLSRYKKVAFTSCAPGNQDWVMHADRLKMNKQTGKGAAKHTWLEIKGVPLLYIPYVSFPMDDRRMTGVLSPSFGSKDENGFDLTVPYYWNIAPNYDLIVRPRYMSKRGGMIGGEFRYLTEMTNGEVGIEFLPYDLLKKEQRYSGTFKNRTVFSPHWTSNIDLNYVSDNEYFDDLNNALGISNDRYLQSQADLKYRREGISFSTHLESYQTIDKIVKSENKPYQKLPQITLNLDHSFDDWPVDIALKNEYVNFYRRNGRVRGHRINVQPSIAVPLKTAGSFITPKVSLKHTQYFLSNQKKDTENSISRTLPIFSVDSGLIFERDFKSKDSNYMHTIEPRLFYLYIPNKNQDDIPTFDSSLYDYSYSSLFRENSFSGNDRVQDANQISMAITSRLIDSKSGQERLKLSVGEIFYFRDREVTLPNKNIERRDFSNLIAELSGHITKKLSFSTGIHWDPYENDLARGHAKLTYREGSEKIVNLGYRYRGEDPINNDLESEIRSINRTDVSFRWPIIDDWYGVGRWQYSIKYHSTTESFLGLEKESCCWRFRFIWRRFSSTLLDDTNPLLNLEDNEMDEGFFVQIELKGLTSFGDNVDEFLEKNLSGYQSPD